MEQIHIMELCKFLFVSKITKIKFIKNVQSKNSPNLYFTPFKYWATCIFKILLSTKLSSDCSVMINKPYSIIYICCLLNEDLAWIFVNQAADVDDS